MPARNIMVTFADAITFPGRVEKAVDTPVETSNFCIGQDGTTHDPSPVKAPRKCEHCGDLPSYGEAGLVKGIKEGSHTFRILNSEELAAIDTKFKGDFKGQISLVPVPSEDFLSVTGQGEQINFITPNGPHGATQYKTLIKLIEAHPELSFVGLHTPVSKTALYHVRVHKGALIMEQRVRQDNMRQVPEIAAGEVNEQMLGFLESLLPSMVIPYSATDYEDKYARALATLTGESAVVAIGSRAEVVAPTHTDNEVNELLAKRMAKMKKPAAKKVAAARKTTTAKKTTRKRVSA